MESGRLHNYASRRLTAWSKQSLPGWWTLLTLLVGAGFFVYLAHAMITGGGQPQPPSRDLPQAFAPAPQPPTQPTRAAHHGTTAPGRDHAATTAPYTNAGAGAGQVHVKSWDGTTVSVPAAAKDVANLAFRAMIDPAVTPKVPTTTGTPLPRPGRGYPAATITGLALASDPTPHQLLFSALVDLDGSGPLVATTAYENISLVHGHWAVLVSSGRRR